VLTVWLTAINPGPMLVEKSYSGPIAFLLTCVWANQRTRLQYFEGGWPAYASYSRKPDHIVLEVG